LEAGEAPEQAVLREVAEELGLDGRIVRSIGNYAFAEKNQILLAYEVSAMGQITTNAELVDVRLLSANELLMYDFGHLSLTRQIIEDWQRLTET